MCREVLFLNCQSPINPHGFIFIPEHRVTTEGAIAFFVETVFLTIVATALLYCSISNSQSYRGTHLHISLSFLSLSPRLSLFRGGGRERASE